MKISAKARNEIRDYLKDIIETIIDGGSLYKEIEEKFHSYFVQGLIVELDVYGENGTPEFVLYNEDGSMEALRLPFRVGYLVRGQDPISTEIDAVNHLLKELVERKNHLLQLLHDRSMP